MGKRNCRTKRISGTSGKACRLVVKTYSRYDQHVAVDVVRRCAWAWGAGGTCIEIGEKGTPSKPQTLTCRHPCLFTNYACRRRAAVMNEWPSVCRNLSPEHCGDDAKMINSGFTVTWISYSSKMLVWSILALYSATIKPSECEVLALCRSWQIMTCVVPVDGNCCTRASKSITTADGQQDKEQFLAVQSALFKGQGWREDFDSKASVR